MMFYVPKIGIGLTNSNRKTGNEGENGYHETEVARKVKL